MIKISNKKFCRYIKKSKISLVRNIKVVTVLRVVTNRQRMLPQTQTIIMLTQLILIPLRQLPGHYPLHQLPLFPIDGVVFRVTPILNILGPHILSNHGIFIQSF